MIWFDNIIQRKKQKTKKYDRKFFVVKNILIETRFLAEFRKEYKQKQTRFQIEKQKIIARIKREYETKRTTNDVDSKKKSKSWFVSNKLHI